MRKKLITIVIEYANDCPYRDKINGNCLNPGWSSLWKNWNGRRPCETENPKFNGTDQKYRYLIPRQCPLENVQYD